MGGDGTVDGVVETPSVSFHEQIHLSRKLIFVISSFVSQQLCIFHSPALLAMSDSKSVVKTSRKCI